MVYRDLDTRTAFNHIKEPKGHEDKLEGTKFPSGSPQEGQHGSYALSWSEGKKAGWDPGAQKGLLQL